MSKRAVGEEAVVLENGGRIWLERLQIVEMMRAESRVRAER